MQPQQQTLLWYHNGFTQGQSLSQQSNQGSLAVMFREAITFDELEDKPNIFGWNNNDKKTCLKKEAGILHTDVHIH